MKRPAGITVLAVLALVGGTIQLVSSLGFFGVSLFQVPAWLGVMSGVAPAVMLSAGIFSLAIAVAAWILCGRVGGADPNSGTNANLESITAVVIGGTSLFGGRGLVIGSLIGAFIVQVFDNGLALAGIDPNYQVFAVGVLVIVAVSVDQWIRSVKA